MLLSYYGTTQNKIRHQIFHGDTTVSIFIPKYKYFISLIGLNNLYRTISSAKQFCTLRKFCSMHSHHPQSCAQFKIADDFNLPQATLALGSSFKCASKIASDIWSHILSISKRNRLKSRDFVDFFMIFTRDKKRGDTCEMTTNGFSFATITWMSFANGFRGEQKSVVLCIRSLHFKLLFWWLPVQAK